MLPAGEEDQGPELARRLRAVLERHLDIDLDTLSPASAGNLQDGLPDGVDTVGQVPDGRGGQDPVFLVRMRDAAGARWAFSRQTVSRIDGWYDALPDRWVRDLVPQRLQRYGPLDVMWWQWLALPLLAALALVAGRSFGSVTTRVLHRLFRRTPTQWDGGCSSGPRRRSRCCGRSRRRRCSCPGWGCGRAPTPSCVRCSEVSRRIGVFWVAWRAVDVWAQFLSERPWAADNPRRAPLLSVTRNLARVFVAVTGLVATLAAFGYPVATVLAGLGIGGIAIAFGAQKTIENLFGSISLAADQPFRVGDFVKIEDFTGNVERIGMRSTQIRTPDRTLVSIPNGKLADMRIEDFAARDRIRFAATLGLACATSEEQLRSVVTGIEALLRATPKVWPETVVASFVAIGASSLDVEVLCWFETLRLRRVPRAAAAGAVRDHARRARGGHELRLPDADAARRGAAARALAGATSRTPRRTASASCPRTPGRPRRCRRAPPCRPCRRPGS